MGLNSDISVEINGCPWMWKQNMEILGNFVKLLCDIVHNVNIASESVKLTKL